MKCMNCGYDNNENARFCQGCGSAFAFEPKSLDEIIRRLLNDELFMILCILFSVNIGFSFLSGSLPVIRIIMMILLWILFAQGRNGISISDYIRFISGTIYASYVVKWILCCISAFVGLALMILFFTMDITGVWNILFTEIESYLKDYFGIFSFFVKSYLRWSCIFLIIKAVVGIILNVLGRRTIHRFVQSIYRSLENRQTHLVKCSSAQTWMMVFGIIEVIYALCDLITGKVISFLAVGCLSAVFIISSILTKKYFGDLNKNTQNASEYKTM